METVTITFTHWVAFLTTSFLAGLLAGLWARGPRRHPDRIEVDPYATLDGTDVVRVLAKRCKESRR